MMYVCDLCFGFIMPLLDMKTVTNFNYSLPILNFLGYLITVCVVVCLFVYYRLFVYVML